MGKSLAYLLPKEFKSKYPGTFEFLRFLKNGDLIPYFSFLFFRNSKIKFTTRFTLLKKFFKISTKVHSPHTLGEIIGFCKIMILNADLEGGYAECGCYLGSSTAKFSLIAKLLNKKLYVFDSFEGIPANAEKHTFNIYGEKTGFREGDFKGSLDEVKTTISSYGSLENCIFIKGWYENSMPSFKNSLSAIYIDVDLASSTKTCLKYLIPLLTKGGSVASQDGHLPLVIEVYRDKDFWNNVLLSEVPHIPKLGRSKFISFCK